MSLHWNIFGIDFYKNTLVNVSIFVGIIEIHVCSIKCGNNHDFLARSRAYGPVMSVCKHDKSPQTQRIDLKFSTHLNEAKSGVKFKNGQNRNTFFSYHEYLIETNIGSMGAKNKLCPIELKFGTLVFLVIKNNF